MKTIDTLIFDFGNVLLTWDPHLMLDKYFGDRDKASWFIENICTSEWNGEMDEGKPFKQGIAELSAKHPEWAHEIQLYFDRWIEMIGGQVEGMEALIKELKAQGFRTYGLTNWSLETFCQVRYEYPIFALMDGMVISAEERCLKPGPKIYQILLDRYHLRPEQCVFIDDRAENVAGAEALGIRGIRFRSAAQLRKDLSDIL